MSNKHMKEALIGSNKKPEDDLNSALGNKSDKGKGKAQPEGTAADPINLDDADPGQASSSGPHAKKPKVTDSGSQASQTILAAQATGATQATGDTQAKKPIILFAPGHIEPDSEEDIAMKDADGGPSSATPKAKSGTASDAVPSAEELNRPKVHYFTYEKQHYYGKPKSKFELGDVIIRNFNQGKAISDLFPEPGAPLIHQWLIPRMYIASDSTLRDDSRLTARDISCYMQQVRKNTGPSTQPITVPTGWTLGRLVAKHHMYVHFVLAPQDLIVLEHIGKDNRSEGHLPYGPTNHFEFCEDGHFQRNSLRHFAWEWLYEYSDRTRAECVKVKHDANCKHIGGKHQYCQIIPSRPVPGVDGVHIWLIDYSLARLPGFKGKKIKDGRHVFYANGARFAEVREEDLAPAKGGDWVNTADLERFAAHTQIKIWEGNRLTDSNIGSPIKHYKWPACGVLAVEFGKF